MEWSMTTTFFFFQDINSALKVACGLTDPGLMITIPFDRFFINTSAQ
jgi:hypothetical protein